MLTGEPGYSVMYRTWARPTLEVHGMPGGFVAPGAKTVIPAKASAKVSMRLVPNQDPDDILQRYKNYVKKLTPKGIQTTIKVWSKGPACVVGTDNKYIKAATEALHDVFKKETVFIRSGGSIPIVTDFQDVLKIPCVMLGFGLPDDNLHAPNEKFHIPNFYRGIETICLFFEKLGPVVSARTMWGRAPRPSSRAKLGKIVVLSNLRESSSSIPVEHQTYALISRATRPGV